VRILHVAWGFRPWRVGGLIAYAEDLAQAQAASGHDVHFLCSGRHYPRVRPAREHTWRRGGVTIHELLNVPVVPGLEAGTLHPLRELDEPAAETAWDQALDRVRPDVVHVHELLGLPSAVLLRARERGVPVVMSLHDYGTLCPKLNLFDVDGRRCLRDDVGAQCARCSAGAPADDRHLVRMTAVYHALRAATLLGPLQEPLKRAWRRLLAIRAERAAAAPPSPPPAAPLLPGPGAAGYQRRRDVNVERLSGVDRLLAVSTRVAEIYARLGVDAERIRVLPITHAGLPHVVPARERPVGSPLAFSAVNALMSRDKGAELLAAALDELEARGYGGRFRLDVWGFAAPAYAAAFERRAGVTLHGPFGPGDLPRIHDAADVALLPSECEETFGFVALEYLAAGVPVLANALGGVTDHVREGETGWLNRDATASGLAEAMARCIDDPGAVAAMRASVRERRARFVKPMPDHVREVEAVYAEVGAGPVSMMTA
jgi:glycosyltransferase involved in cell wall biosynthesis